MRRKLLLPDAQGEIVSLSNYQNSQEIANYIPNSGPPSRTPILRAAWPDWPRTFTTTISKAPWARPRATSANMFTTAYGARPCSLNSQGMALKFNFKRVMKPQAIESRKRFRNSVNWSKSSLNIRATLFGILNLVGCRTGTTQSYPAYWGDAGLLF